MLQRLRGHKKGALTLMQAVVICTSCDNGDHLYQFRGYQDEDLKLTRQQNIAWSDCTDVLVCQGVKAKKV